jgi:hypothetical protein
MRKAALEKLKFVIFAIERIVYPSRPSFPLTNWGFDSA